MSNHPSKPCTECPWRRDVAPGRFPPARFIALAHTAHDMALAQFACHKSPDGKEFACAGFLLRGAEHNLAVRLARSRGDLVKVSDDGYPLFDNFREMAVANGVPPGAPELRRCRMNVIHDDGSHEFDCAECNAHVICSIPRDLPLCAMCQFYPNWFADPALRAILDPDCRPPLPAPSVK